MRTILIIPNPKKDTDFAVTRRVVDTLDASGAEILLPAAIADRFHKEVEGTKKPDAVIVIGGDGSVLDASAVAIGNDVPLLGVNLGKVGYLSEVEPENLSLLGNLFTGRFTIDEKMLLEVSAGDTENRLETSSRLAVNDCVISHDVFLGIADFSVFCRGEEVRYRADGLTVATPAGSTAYSLSAGGPVLADSVSALLITPICPHSFFNRSIVLPEGETVTVRNNGEAPIEVSIDGRRFRSLGTGGICRIRKSAKKLKMIRFDSNRMIATLFAKLNIMEDVK